MEDSQKKQIFLSGFLLLNSVLCFYFLNNLLFKEGFVISLFSFIPFIIFLFLTGICFFFLSLTFDRLFWQVGIFFLAAFLIFLFFEINWYTISGAIIFFLILLWSQKRIIKEKNNYLKFDFWHQNRACLKTFNQAFAILIAILLFLSPKILGGKLTIPLPLFDISWPFIEQVLTQQYQGLPEDKKLGEMSVDEFIFINLSSRLQDGEMLPREDMENLVSQEEIEYFRQDFARSLQIEREIGGDELIKDLIYEKISYQIDKFISNFEIYGSIGVISAFYLIVRVIFILLTFLFVAFGFLGFKILKKLNFFKIEKEKIEREVFKI